LDICRGLRPNVKADTPNSLKKLIERCWDANPKNRPTSKEICDINLDILNDYTNQIQVEEQKNSTYNFYESINTAINSSITTETHSQANYTNRNLDLPPHLPEPTNCLNQQEFISSRIIIQDVQTSKFIFINFYLFDQNYEVNEHIIFLVVIDKFSDCLDCKIE
jgi:hypothetical protein